MMPAVPQQQAVGAGAVRSSHHLLPGQPGAGVGPQAVCMGCRSCRRVCAPSHSTVGVSKIRSDRKSTLLFMQLAPPVVCINYKLQSKL